MKINKVYFYITSTSSLFGQLKIKIYENENTINVTINTFQNKKTKKYKIFVALTILA